ncbi:PH domain-containing protein [Gottschalkiaceae bacterium SANA]|nr:PH domain-containing protein [Gottschalkiaceae bacterium SANA]
MIDFDNKKYLKLSPVSIESGTNKIIEFLIEGEEVIGAYKSMRDMVIFTSKRIVAVNVQGITGKKIDYSSLAYSKIQAFSVETAGTFDLDSELEVWFSGLGKMKFEFKGNVNIRGICKVISEYTL